MVSVPEREPGESKALRAPCRKVNSCYNLPEALTIEHLKDSPCNNPGIVNVKLNMAAFNICDWLHAAGLDKIWSTLPLSMVKRI